MPVESMALKETSPKDEQEHRSRPSPSHHVLKLTTENPTGALAVFALITLFFLVTAGGVDFLTKGPEVESHRPGLAGGEQADNLILIEEDWSTEFLMVYVKIPDPDVYPVNISSSDVLREMGAVEEAVNSNRTDRGLEDGVVASLSLASLVKEFNSTQTRLQDSLLVNTALFLSHYAEEGINPEDVADGVNVNAGGGYSIPSNQDTIQGFVERMPPELIDKLVVDTNNDSIWDVAVIIFAMEARVDRDRLIETAREAVEAGEGSGITEMTVFGDPVIYQSEEELVEEYFWVVFPVLVVLTAVGILQFRRSFKAVVISIVPPFCALIWAFGFFGLTGMPLTPAAAYFLLLPFALGVIWGSRFASRFSQGEDRDPITRAQKAMEKEETLLSGASIGAMLCFASLMFSSLEPLIVPGLGLMIGTLFTFQLFFLMGPALAVVVDYKKKPRHNEIAFSKASKTVLRNYKAIIAISLVLMILSLSLAPQLKTTYAPFSQTSEDPGLESYRSNWNYIYYSGNFSASSQGFVMVEVEPGEGFVDPDYESTSASPVEILDETDALVLDINRLKQEEEIQVQAVGISTLMDSVSLNATVQMKEL